MLRKGARPVMTARDHIYNRATHELKVGAFLLRNASQVVIDVHNPSGSTRNGNPRFLKSNPPKPDRT